MDYLDLASLKNKEYIEQDERTILIDLKNEIKKVHDKFISIDNVDIKVYCNELDDMIEEIELEIENIESEENE